ncbi:carbohydrate kinase family protein, partial [Candidatus Uhrbacteria bacterium]|nr:carbohydrate kinase family protein [Candidatus Uhrbacteria bacterium]
MYDVITIGAATRDVFLVSRAFMLVPLPELGGNLGECVALGSKIDIDDIVLTTGGGATNAAVTFAKLGMRVATITRVGDDEPGRAVLADLETNHVDTSMVKVVKHGQTGYSTILTAQNGERTILVYRGVSADQKESDLKTKRLKTRWLYVTSLGGNAEMLMRLVWHAKADDLAIAFNPGAGEIKLGLRALDQVIRHLSILILNLEEAQELTKLQTTNVKDLAGKLARPGLTLVITDGPRGTHAFLDDTYWHCGTRSIRSVSRTGAGDAFGSAFVAARMQGRDMEDALRIGTANAESVISHFGAKAGIIKSFPSQKVLMSIPLTSDEGYTAQ